MEPHAVRNSTDDIRRRPVESGRDPATIKLVASILIIVEEADEKAQAKCKDNLSCADLERSLAFSEGWTGVDLDDWTQDEDFQFTGPSAVQSLVSS